MIVPGSLNAMSLGSIARYVPNAIDADGTNDWMSNTGYNGAADAPNFMLLAFLRIDGGDGALRPIHIGGEGSASVQVYLFSDNKFYVIVTDGTSTLNFSSNSAYLAGPSWISLMVGCQTDLSAGNKITQMYINDASDLGTVVDASASFNIDFTLNSWGIYANTSGALKWNGCISNLMVFFGERLDLSVTANRRKYVTATNKPVNPGATGTLITGNQPIAFYAGAAGAPGVNSGSGGNATVTGSFDVCSSNPGS